MLLANTLAHSLISTDCASISILSSQVRQRQVHGSTIVVTGRAEETSHSLKVSGVQCSENTSNIQYSPHSFPPTSVFDFFTAVLLQLIWRHNSRKEKRKFFSYVIRIKASLSIFVSTHMDVCPVSLAANVSCFMWWYLKIKHRPNRTPCFVSDQV